MADIALTEDEIEYKKIHRNYIFVVIAALIILTTGTIFFHYVESLKWLDSIYFCTITLTTVGYGDIVPKTDAGKIFDIFYVLAGIGILATFASLFIKNATLRRHVKKDRARSKRQQEQEKSKIN